MSFKYGVVITGLIASGKSSVCELLRAQNYEIICADSIAHAVLDENSSKIAELFGAEFIKNGAVDRKALGALVFSDKEAKRRLEELLHPLIHAKILKFSQNLESKKKLYFVDIPLFFESGGKQKYDFGAVLLVYAPKELCLERILSRDKLDIKSAKLRLNSQIDIEIKRQKTDFVLSNTGDLGDLKRNLDKILKKIEKIVI